MEPEAVLQVLTNCGGYAALCILLLREMTAMRQEHKEEVRALSEVIAANTAAIEGLKERVSR